MTRLYPDLAADNIGVAPVQQLQLCLQPMAMSDVVRVHSCDDRGGTTLCPGICGGRDTAMLLPVDLQSQVFELSEYGWRLIRGTVVHYDQFQITERLIQN